MDLRLASDLPLAVAGYRRCDVLVVNAIADGMNLVAKEAVIVNEHDMVLALSESTGAHGELGSFAVTLHPFDVAQQADALHQALTMPQQQRAELLRAAAEVVRPTTSNAGSPSNSPTWRASRPTPNTPPQPRRYPTRPDGDGPANPLCTAPHRTAPGAQHIPARLLPPTSHQGPRITEQCAGRPPDRLPVRHQSAC